MLQEDRHTDKKLISQRIKVGLKQSINTLMDSNGFWETIPKLTHYWKLPIPGRVGCNMPRSAESGGSVGGEKLWDISRGDCERIWIWSWSEWEAGITMPEWGSGLLRLKWTINGKWSPERVSYSNPAWMIIVYEWLFLDQWVIGSVWWFR